jgi:small subunit ribosomal protein S6
MRERRRDYELMFIISPLRSSEEDITTTISRVQQAVANAGGAVTDTEQGPPWGRRKFAYPIREYAEGEASRRAFSEGYYVLCHFNLPAARIPDIERSLKLNDAVLRYLLTLVDTRGQAIVPSIISAISATSPADQGDADTDEDVDEDVDEFEDEDAEAEEA